MAGLQSIVINENDDANTVKNAVSRETIGDATMRKLREGTISHRTADVLDELARLQENVQTIEKRTTVRKK
jgi:hypothetical protein